VAPTSEGKKDEKKKRGAAPHWEKMASAILDVLQAPLGKKPTWEKDKLCSPVGADFNISDLKESGSDEKKIIERVQPVAKSAGGPIN